MLNSVLTEFSGTSDSGDDEVAVFMSTILLKSLYKILSYIKEAPLDNTKSHRFETINHLLVKTPTQLPDLSLRRNM